MAMSSQTRTLSLTNHRYNCPQIPGKLPGEKRKELSESEIFETKQFGEILSRSYTSWPA